MDRELLYNASGVRDETAYKAIKNVMKERGTMNVVNKGEIWEVENGIDTKTVVVINCYEKYAATVMLQEREPGDNAVRVIAHGSMYVDAGRLGWTYYDKMVEFVRVLNQEEEQELRRAIGTALGIEPYESLEVDIFRLREELAEAQGELKAKAEELEVAYDQMEANAARVDELEALAAGLRKELAGTKEATAHQGTAELVEERGLRESLAAAQREAQIYKGLYENMLSRALGA